MAKKIDLVGVTEVREMLGVSRQRVHQLLHEDKTFPEPVAEVSGGRIWLRQDVLAWAKKTGRLQ